MTETAIPESDSTDEGSPSSDGLTLLAEARDLLGDVVAIRRRIHAEPELGLDLPITQSTVLESLADLDLEVKCGGSLSSVVATLVGEAAGPTVLLRADMDALPMAEDQDLSFVSRHEGRMHACGHDAHVAMLLGAARLLSRRRSELRGTVKFLFQPGEEGYGGAVLCLDEGLLDSPVVDAAFALHVSPNDPSGVLVIKPGPVLASSDEITLTIRGSGGHASAPHFCVDPVPVAAEIVLALQTMITRTVDVFDPAVLTVAKVEAGTTYNVIPDSATMAATLRTVSEATRQKVLDSITRVARNVAAAHECVAEVAIRPGYPVTVNDPEFVEFSSQVMRDLVGHDQVRELESPVMASEDWSYVLQRVPGAMAMLGACPPGVDPALAPGCHSSKMQLDEDAMVVGVATHAAVALAYLA